jgi:cytochrome c oxidase subunit 4
MSSTDTSPADPTPADTTMADAPADLVSGHAHTHHGEHDDAGAHDDHWTDFKYVQLAIALAIVTAIEVALSYMVDDIGKAFLPLLLILMLVKFFSVVMFFMHLKFDNKLFSLLFYMGLGLAVSVYIVTLFTFKFFDA